MSLLSLSLTLWSSLPCLASILPNIISCTVGMWCILAVECLLASSLMSAVLCKLHFSLSSEALLEAALSLRILLGVVFVSPSLVLYFCCTGGRVQGLSRLLCPFFAVPSTSAAWWPFCSSFACTVSPVLSFFLAFPQELKAWWDWGLVEFGSIWFVGLPFCTELSWLDELAEDQ